MSPAGLNPFLSNTPSVTVPPCVFAKADMVSGTLLGKPPAADLTSYSARSVPAARMRSIALARSLSVVMNMGAPGMSD